MNAIKPNTSRKPAKYPGGTPSGVTAKGRHAMIRHTTCRKCGQDIEGHSPYRRGEWRDRGNNTHCPNAAGDAGQVHAPVPFGARRKLAERIGSALLLCLLPANRGAP